MIKLQGNRREYDQYIQYIVMFIYRLAARGSEVIGLRRVSYGIISNLFKKRNQAEAEAPKGEGKEREKKEEQEREMEDQEYNFFERRKEIDTGLDFSKLREMNTTYIPEDLGKGGIEEVLYWSQNVSTPEQIKTIVAVFNKIASQTAVSQYFGNVQLQQFKTSVINTVYLVDSLQGLHEYSLFAMRYEIRNPQFWEKVEFKCMKFVPKSEEEVSYLVDVTFVMGRFEIGEEIFNFIQKILAEASFNIDQSIKLFLVFSSLKKGEKLWIEMLLQGIADHVHEADAEQLTGVLQNLKEAKKLPDQMNERIQKRVYCLIDQLTLPQLLNISAYFGFEHENQQFWKLLQTRSEELLKTRKIGSKTLDLLIHKCMLTYKFSTDFIRRYIARPLQTNPTQILQKLTPRTLSALSKGLYIYQLQNQTGHIQQQIGKLIIGQITQQINQISDEQLIKVIQDYNLTRHGNRQLYIFFEQVIKVKFIRHYNPELNRNTIQLLIEIYKNSGMCSREMFDSLQNLILQ